MISFVVFVSRRVGFGVCGAATLDPHGRHRRDGRLTQNLLSPGMTNMLPRYKEPTAGPGAPSGKQQTYAEPLPGLAATMAREVIFLFRSFTLFAPTKLGFEHTSPAKTSIFRIRQ